MTVSDGVVAALSSVVTAGTVEADLRRRAEYSTDASNYRVPPEAVVFPADTDELVAALDVLRQEKVPVTLRGGGTSVAGNAIGPGVVIDTSRHLTAGATIDAKAATASNVPPGMIMSDLQAQAREHGLRFGPDPSTQNRATFGGMIGNNACGPHAVAYGRTADNVIALDVVDGNGRRFTAGSGDEDFREVPGLKELVRENLALIRTEFGRFGRQVSGYSLEHLLPENGSDLAKALVGTEGTCVTVLSATLRLVPLPKSPTLLVLGYDDMPAAADDVPALLAVGVLADGRRGVSSALAIEGIDARLVDVVRNARGADAVPELPKGGGWLMVEVGGGTESASKSNARAILRASSAKSSAIIPPGPEAERMWRIRADGAGLAGRIHERGTQAWPGWEDSAVPPEKLGAYLRDLDALMARYKVDGYPYGHFGDGCIHLRIDIPLAESGSVLRTFMTDAAALVAKYGGSISGEHGDGRARSELLPTMYSQAALVLMRRFKALFDPKGLLNPGVLVDSDAAEVEPLDANLRRPAAKPLKRGSGFQFAHDGNNMMAAVHRCVGVGKCRADSFASGGFMCPSYQATRDEKESTRGRARVLQEATNGTLIAGVAAREVRESLDLCLACKACSADCPAGVDMAQFKSETLHRTYKGRMRPVDHYVLGWLPRWLRLLGRFRFAVPMVNAVLSVRPISRIVLRLGGMDTRRKMMRFERQPFSKWWRASGQAAVEQARTAAESDEEQPFDPMSPPPPPPARQRVVLWVDSFSEGLASDVPQAAVRVLTAARYDVIVPDGYACCGLTWISTGQLDGAKRRMKKLLDVLAPFAVNGVPIMGLEPSCTGVLRSDLLDLFPDDPRAAVVASATRTLTELLTDPATAPIEWEVPDLSDLKAVVQPHCHHHSVMGFSADERLLREAGADVTVLAGCCGLAGNFGMQKGHYETSVAVAENQLLPALREADEDTEYLADGFSCRTQAVHLADVQGKALVQVLAERL